MTSFRKDTPITVIDPDIEPPVCAGAWYQAARAEGFYAVLEGEPLAQRFFAADQLVEAPHRVWRAIRAAARPAPAASEKPPANVIRLRFPG
jgi:hypothetical protein